jgi:hypothetical protein
MVRRRINVLAALAIGLAISSNAPPATARNDEAAEPVDAIWREHRINFDYHSFNVHYSCSGLQRKVSSILQAMGAHQDIAVAVNCNGNDLVTSVNMLLTLKVPVVASEENVRAATTYTTQQELVARLQRVQLPSATDLQRFSATWRTVALTRNRRLGLDSGDCDLLIGVRDQLLPKLGISTTKGGFHCYGSGTRTRPTFRIAAWLPVEPPTLALAGDSGAMLPTVD